MTDNKSNIYDYFVKDNTKTPLFNSPLTLPDLPLFVHYRFFTSVIIFLSLSCASFYLFEEIWLRVSRHFVHIKYCCKEDSKYSKFAIFQDTCL